MTDCSYDVLLDRPPSPWRRSRKGWWYRRWPTGSTTTLYFNDYTGAWHYVIARRNEAPRYSKRGWLSEDAAERALLREMAA